MISRFLYILDRGITRVRANTKLVFVVLLLFVFPMLFILVLEQFYTISKANIQTVELQRVAAMHDSVSALLPLDRPALISEVTQSIFEQNTDLVSFRVYEELSTDEIKVIASAVEAEIFSTSTPTTLLQLGKVTPTETFKVPLENTAGRVEQAVRYVRTDNRQFYIFSEHDRSHVDMVMNQRKLNAYIVLSLIFSFLIALAYWINRQSDWEKQYKMLDQTLQERDLFSSMIAHEFRAPLTAIKGYASFLKESPNTEDQDKRYVDTISESAERLILLVNDFLEIARIQSGKMKIEMSEIDVRTTIESVVGALRNNADQKKLTLIYTPNLKPQLLHTDQNRLIQILTNIISNSVKYTQSGTVEVSCDQDRSGITIRIKDTGMGISADDQHRLFTPFSRVGGVDKTTTTGTGLGMWITKQMIELLNGSISVESIKGVGTHVVLHFKQSKH